MKKLVHVFLLSLVATLFISCDLTSFFGFSDGNHEQYFYSLVEGEDNISNYTLSYRDDGYTIIMSCGIGGRTLTQSEAEAIKDGTSFTLNLNGTPVDLLNDKTTSQLDDTGYHVVQSSPVLHIEKGTHIIIGVTNFASTGEGSGGTRKNTLSLTIE